MTPAGAESSGFPAMRVSPVDYSVNATCKHCGYALFGLPEQRCPECGQAFNWSDPATMNVPGWKPPAKAPITLGQWALMISSVATGLVLMLGPDAVAAWAIGFTLWGIILFASTASFGIGRLIRRKPSAQVDKPRWWRRGVLLMALISVVFSVRIAQCPHASQLFLGPLGFVLNGKPCHNQPEFRSIYTFIFNP